MAKKLSFTPLFFFLCITLLVCQSLGLAIEKKAVANDDINTNVQAEYNAMSSKEADWFHFIPHLFIHPRLPWPGVNPPLPAGFPKIQWPFVHPPLPSGGFPKIQWPFVHPPLPSGGFKVPPLLPWHPWYHPHPWIPPYMFHPHGETESVEIDNAGGDVVTVAAPPPPA
ncbi:Uncharacterized protein Adt_34118 [Abeliophyllum distichum]|uniref:Uncharacterized protein n=1 Tax=Abeliophyllum distichum TaxID=126358 RepID=A0ABD1QY72_9LAMI